MQNYANKKYWQAMQKGERNGELAALSRNGMPKARGFMTGQYKNHSYPVALSRLNSRQKPEPVVASWT